MRYIKTPTQCLLFYVQFKYHISSQDLVYCGSTSPFIQYRRDTELPIYQGSYSTLYVSPHASEYTIRYLVATNSRYLAKQIFEIKRCSWLIISVSDGILLFMCLGRDVYLCILVLRRYIVLVLQTEIGTNNSNKQISVERFTCVISCSS